MVVYKLLSGDVDGVNTVFTTPTDYASDRIVVFRNGQLYKHNITELSTNTVELDADCTPKPGDVISAMYMEL